LHLSSGLQWAACLAAVLIGVWASDETARWLGKHDPSEVVVDEVAGMWLALVGLPHELPVAGAAFLLFRVFDIGKPSPLKQLERLPGGWGIMLDDVAAGAITRLTLGIVLLLLRGPVPS